jgi:putative membrane protein
VREKNPHSKLPFKDRLQLHMANERTFLAWTRTALNMIAIGFLVFRFNLTGSSIILESKLNWSKSAVYGSLLIMLGVVINLVATTRFLFFRKEIEKGEGIFPYAIDLIMTASVVLIAIVLIAFSQNAIR